MTDYTVQRDGDPASPRHVQAPSIGELRRQQMREMANAANDDPECSDANPVPVLWECYVWHGKVEDIGERTHDEVVQYWQYPDKYREPSCRAAGGPGHAWETAGDNGAGCDDDVCVRCGCVRESARDIQPVTVTGEPAGAPVDMYTYRPAHFYVRWEEWPDRRPLPLDSLHICDAIEEAAWESKSIFLDAGGDRRIDFVIFACQCESAICEACRDTPYNIELYRGHCVKAAGPSMQGASMPASAAAAVATATSA